MTVDSFKAKYLELRSRYMNDVDIAFRLGFEQGAQQAQQQSALDAQAKNREMGHQHGIEKLSSPTTESGSQELKPEGGESPDTGMQQPDQGSELDQHINKLQGMLGSSEDPEIKKSLDAILSIRKSEKFALDMKKSESAIAGIAKALHKPAFKMGVQAQHNMDTNAKQALTLQHKIVDDVFKAWQTEQDKGSKDILQILDVENVTKR